MGVDKLMVLGSLVRSNAHFSPVEPLNMVVQSLSYTHLKPEQHSVLTELARGGDTFTSLHCSYQLTATLETAALPGSFTEIFRLH